MARDLTNSTVDRQNILNNQYALNEIQLGNCLMEGDNYWKR